ncbi:hypothetical protein UA08_01517 [Talaromyces atroroseus]|uniref:FHA domain-containing protein n=1 Tax=Talaromyces atroroseus TaxID=1441469 RepID=A0A1Q5QBV0_TALAT|nr:hypothetical protein UA08_01517 [Talaromyces atroroseus]OKL63386.1 hypothetical protein UA08_01517 [Talaromyces atroroseus]
MPPSDTDNRDRRRQRSPHSYSPDATGGRSKYERREERKREKGYDNGYTRRRRSQDRSRERHRNRRDDGHRKRVDRSVSPRSRERRDYDSHRRRRRDSPELDGPKEEPSARHDRRRRSPSRDNGRRRRSAERRSHSRSTQAPVRSRGPLPSQNDAFQSTDITETNSPAPVKEKPNFANTGRLAAESNTVTVNGGSVVLKYHEPAEARKPPVKDDWRLYVFKGEDLLEMVQLGERSCWLIGREKLVVDFPIEHPSCSKQHAAIQFRYVEKKNEFGDKTGRVRPYLIDLESSNGSMVNGDAIPGGRFVEIRDKDVLKFGHSTREYVIMLSQA